MRRSIEPMLCVLVNALLLFSVCDLVKGQGFPGHWVARWVWANDEPHPFHFFLMARRSFVVNTSPRSAKLDITASDRYMLYVNGEYLGRGPARSDPRWMSYDVYDVGSHLRTGRNTVAVLAYHYGCQNAYSRDARAGLFVQLDVTGSDGSRQVIGTDKNWRVRHARAWRRDVNLINMAVGVTEAYDANLDPPDWTAPDFDDSSWGQAYVIPEYDSPWNYLEPRQTPMLREAEVFPVKVVSVGEVREVSRIVNGFTETSPSETQVPERLAADIYFPLQHAKVGNVEAVLRADTRAAHVQSFPFKKEDIAEKGRWSPYIIVDFGRPLFGFPRVRLEGAAGGIVEMTYGPDLLDGRVYPLLQGVRYGDRYTMREGKQTWQVFEYKQFRYLMMVFRGVEKPVSVDSISVVDYEYPASRKGSFECSEPVLTKLWRACVDTTYLSLEDAPVADAIRERRVWTGDGSHELWAIWAAFGDVPITDWYFRLMARGHTADGLVRPFYPGTDPAAPGFGGVPPKKATTFENPGHIPQHALVYLTALGIYHRYFGKRQLIQDLYPALVNLVAWFERRADETGLLYKLPYWNWVDWVAVDYRGANFETNVLYYQGLMYMSEFAQDLGKTEEAARWKSKAERVQTSLRRLFWNAQARLYMDSFFDGRQSPKATETANGMALMYGIATPDQVPEIVRRLGDPHTDIVRASPLFVDYSFEGLMKAGAVETALQEMQGRFAPMMAASDTPTLWERWSSTPDSDTAIVHGGAAGIAWTLSRYVLGVHAEETGFRRCRIEPQTGQLAWARGVFPSVRGDIKVGWEKDSRHFILDTMLPEGLDTDLILPRDISKTLQLTHNGKQFGIHAGAKSVPGVRLSEDRIVIRVLGGSHHLELAWD